MKHNSKKDSLAANKIFAAIVIALLVGIVATIVSRYLVAPTPLSQNAYVVEGVSAVEKETVQAPKILEPITPLMASANADKGKSISKKCLQCHTFDKGGANKVGPNLWGIVGAKIGHMDGFAYSQAFKAKQGKWTLEELNHFLYKPRDCVPGTKMAFVGLSDAQERADMISYLKTLT